MAAGTLYTYPENWRAFKALIAAQYSGAQVRVLSAPPHFHFGQTNRTPEFLRKFPAGKVPAFEGDDGFCVFESNAIAYYVSNEDLRGSSPEAAAQVVQWVSFADSDIVPPASTWVFPTLGIMHYNKQATETAKEDMRRILGLLDAHLKTRTFLVGERVTLADITVVCTLLWLYKQVLEPSFRQAFPNTNRWFLTCINQPQFRAVLGEVKLCEKMAQFDAKKFAESQPKKDTPRKEKGPREEKPKPQAERKEEKKAAAPAAEEEMDECEQALAAEPKAKDPFAHLPKSLESGSSEARSSPFRHTRGGSWIPAARRPRRWCESTFAGRGPSSTWAKPSIRARSSSEHRPRRAACTRPPGAGGH
uniref:Eukaryotic translation elongation factor 1 gamma n=1 Tax=Myotis myotis TaxID=51298 RepID=A0A7J7RH92_MYOMY|nr:eukaryotic translation elongation factor 1 gamma [Myotis myotis]